jgi:hypothetical protein
MPSAHFRAIGNVEFLVGSSYPRKGAANDVFANWTQFIQLTALLYMNINKRQYQIANLFKIKVLYECYLNKFVVLLLLKHSSGCLIS